MTTYRILHKIQIRYRSDDIEYPEAMVKMIDECPYKDGYEFDWHYTLSQWVVYYLANKFTVLLDSKFSTKRVQYHEMKI